MALGPSAVLSDRRTVEAVVAIRIFLGLVFQNLARPEAAALFGPEIPVTLAAGLLDLFDVIPEEARLLLAQGMLDDRMLRGEWAAEYLDRLLAMDPMPESIELLLDAYSYDKFGAGFVADLHKTRSTAALQYNPEIIAVSVRERLLELGKPEYAVTLFQGSPSREEKLGILEAVTQFNDRSLVLQMAQLDGENGLAGPSIDEGEFRISLLTLASEGALNAEDICKYLREQPDSMHSMLYSALIDEADSWLPRYVLGFSDPRAPAGLPPCRFSEQSESLAWSRLVTLVPVRDVTDDEVDGLRIRLLASSDPRVQDNLFYAWGALAGPGATAERRDLITRELTRIADSGAYPDATRERARRELKR